MKGQGVGEDYVCDGQRRGIAAAVDPDQRSGQDGRPAGGFGNPDRDGVNAQVSANADFQAFARVMGAAITSVNLINMYRTQMLT